MYILTLFFSLTELNGLLNEEDKILEMIQKMSEVSKMKEDREKLSNECIELASKYTHVVSLFWIYPILGVGLKTCIPQDFMSYFSDDC